jgi:hypothetical protein
MPGYRPPKPLKDYEVPVPPPSTAPDWVQDMDRRFNNRGKPIDTSDTDSKAIPIPNPSVEAGTDYSRPPHLKDYKMSGGSIHIKKSHKGLLHKDLGVKQGSRIPESAIKNAEHSSSAAVRKRAVFAENARHWHHAEGGRVKAPHNRHSNY